MDAVHRNLTVTLVRDTNIANESKRKQKSWGVGGGVGGALSYRPYYSLSPGVWQSFVTIRSCNHLMRIISTYVDNTKKSEIS